MSHARAHLTQCLRTGLHGALAALAIGLATGIVGFAVTAAPEPVEAAEDLAAAAPSPAAWLRAIPEFVAPTASPTLAATAEAEGTAMIHAAVSAAEVPAAEEPAPASPAAVVATPVPAATPRPVASAALVPEPVLRADHASIVEAIYSVWPAELAPTAVLIAQCESSMNPAARNPYSGAAGLFQSLGHGPVPADVYGQAVQALAIYQEAGGWRPWVSSAYCWR